MKHLIYSRFCLEALKQYKVLDTEQEIDEVEESVKKLYEAADGGSSSETSSESKSSGSSSSSSSKGKRKSKKKKAG